jgi:hypothetical protein
MLLHFFTEVRAFLGLFFGPLQETLPLQPSQHRFMMMLSLISLVIGLMMSSVVLLGVGVVMVRSSVFLVSVLLSVLLLYVRSGSVSSGGDNWIVLS